jgi:hypothetical protein
MHVNLTDYGNVTKHLPSMLRHSGLKHAGMEVIGLCRHRYLWQTTYESRITQAIPRETMSRSIRTVCFFFMSLMLTSTVHVHPSTAPTSSGTYPKVTQRMAEQGKARKLFEYARSENSNLRWDPCLARKAVGRAKKMLKTGYFDHKDPDTGRNPAWRMVTACHRCTYAGENLAKGDEPAKSIHEALMDSPTHRKNILNAKFDLLGVGCYEDICVELFAGL